jgi:hypothetical protein
MQIFVRLRSGKTVCVDVTKEWAIGNVIEEMNRFHKKEGELEYTRCIYKEAYYGEDHPMNVEPMQKLEPETKLQDLYERKIIKEIVLISD